MGGRGVENKSILKYLHFVYYKHASLELAVMANNSFFACGDLEILFSVVCTSSSVYSHVKYILSI